MNPSRPVAFATGMETVAGWASARPPVSTSKIAEIGACFPNVSTGRLARIAAGAASTCDTVTLLPFGRPPAGRSIVTSGVSSRPPFAVVVKAPSAVTRGTPSGDGLSSARIADSAKAEGARSVALAAVVVADEGWVRSATGRRARIWKSRKPAVARTARLATSARAMPVRGIRAALGTSLPDAPPDSGSGGGTAGLLAGFAGGASRSCARRPMAPICMRLPERSRCRCVLTSSTRVPPVEPRSTTSQPPGTGRISAWTRDTCSSSRKISQSLLRPMRSVRPGSRCHSPIHASPFQARRRGLPEFTYRFSPGGCRLQRVIGT